MKFIRALIAAFAIVSPAFIAAAEQKVVGADPITDAMRSFLAGDLEAASTALSAAEKAGTPEAVRLTVRGAIHAEQGKLDEAVADFRAAREKDPALFGPPLFLADALLRQKKWDEARDLYVEMEKSNKNMVTSERSRYGSLLSRLGVKDEDGARAALDRVVFPTESPAYYYAQAAWAFAHGDHKGAAKWLKTAEGIFDHKQTAWFARPLYDFGWIKTKPPLVLD